MKYKFQYTDQISRQSIIDSNVNKFLIEEDNYLNDENFLIFSDTQPEPLVGILTDVQASKIAQMNDFCGQAIVSTFTSKSFDGTTSEPYDCQLTDQARINGLVSVAQLVLLKLATEPITYKNSNEPICVTWTAQQMLELGLDLKRHVESLTDQYEKLKVYINSLTNIDDVNKVTWNMTIPS